MAMPYDSAATAQVFPRPYGWRHLAPSAANAMPAWYAPASVPKAPYYGASCGDQSYYPQPQQAPMVYHQAYNPYAAAPPVDPRVPQAYFPNRSVALPHPRQAHQQQQRSYQSDYYPVPQQQQSDVWDCALSSARRSYEGAQVKKPAVYGAPYLTPPHSGELSARMPKSTANMEPYGPATGYVAPGALFQPHTPSQSRCTESPSGSVAQELMLMDGPRNVFDGLELISSASSVIPPHPSVQDSAVPYATFAADLIMEVCVASQAKVAANSAASSASPYGAIGGERKQSRKQQRTQQPAYDPMNFDFGLSSGSDSSPASSDGPLTPPLSSESSACPLPDKWQKAHPSIARYDCRSTSSVPWDSSARGSSKKASAEAEAAMKHDKFRKFTSELLNVTLVSPQVILLALYYVHRITRSDPDSILANFDADSAPYRLLIGSLMLANKQHDDHSYRNSTWASVARVSIADVGICERYVLHTLKWDVAVSAESLSSFLRLLQAAAANADRTVHTKITGLLSEFYHP